MRCLLCLVFLAALFHWGVHSQTQFTERRTLLLGGAEIGDCPEPTENILSDLIPRVFSPNDGASRPSVSITNFAVVCQASGLTRGTVNSFSAVVTYSCVGSQDDCNGSPRTDQFQIDCSSDNTIGPNVEGSNVRTTDVMFTLNPPRTLEQQCGQCVQGSNELGLTSDENSHCVACQSGFNNCTEGQRWCTGFSGDRNLPAQFCCNWYVENRCVVTCPGALQGDMDGFDCGCGELELANGNITYSNRFAVNSVATHICDSARGYSLSGNSNQRICTLPQDPSQAGWSGDEITCEVHTCDANRLERPENGDFNLRGSEFGSVVTFSCKDDFELIGDKTRTCTIDGWNGSNPKCEPKVTEKPPIATEPQSGGGCNTACIIGIVVAVLAVIGITALLVGVAYAIYSYMSNPNTKLAKLDPNGINGVARDNPLYVDPDAVVGAEPTDAVVGAEAA